MILTRRKLYTREEPSRDAKYTVKVKKEKHNILIILLRLVLKLG